MYVSVSPITFIFPSFASLLPQSPRFIVLFLFVCFFSPFIINARSVLNFNVAQLVVQNILAFHFGHCFVVLCM